MGDTNQPRACSTCPAICGSVVDRGEPFGPLCDHCWADVQALEDHRQALTEGADAPAPPAPPLCRDCGTEQDRFETGYGHWVLLEPRTPLPAHIVPDGQRWAIGSDGCAVNWGDGFPSDHTCRIRHELVCPVRQRPDTLPPVFGIIWDENRRQCETSMSDTG
ncbi:DUF6083 domain-containing protein [Streptomyces sp. NPDC005336]|uniref:DUF6083 domain-containing protein n=1 Tax=Streptomyces sp. NPDC005336 TaxID=3157035 RepID=UPI0033B37A0B